MYGLNRKHTSLAASADLQGADFIQLIGHRPRDRAGLYSASLTSACVCSRRLMWPLVAALLMEKKSYITPRKYSQLPEIEQQWPHKPNPETQSSSRLGAAEATNLVLGLLGCIGVMFLYL